MRDIVARIHDEDGTCQDLRGTDAYCSTKNLSDEQFERLLDGVAARSTWPKRRRSAYQNITFLMSAGQRAYLQFLIRALGWNERTAEQFIGRQTKGKGLRNHQAATAVITPLERMLAVRGWRLTERQGEKWWDPPEGTTP